MSSSSLTKILNPQRPSGNANRDAWLAQRSEDELRRLDALAASEGLKLQPATILRPFLLGKGVPNVAGGQRYSLSFYFPFYAYVRRVTSTIQQPKFQPNQEPDAAVVGTLDMRSYFTGTIDRPNGDRLFSEPLTLDQWTGDGKLEYIFDLIPFVTLGDTLNINLEVSPRILSVDLVQITFHCMKFPIEGV